MLLVKEEAAVVYYLLLLAITDCQGHAGNKPVVCVAKAVVVLHNSSCCCRCFTPATATAVLVVPPVAVRLDEQHTHPLSCSCREERQHQGKRADEQPWQGIDDADLLKDLPGVVE